MSENDDYFGRPAPPPPEPARRPGEVDEDGLPPILHRDDHVDHVHASRVTGAAVVLAVLFPVFLALGLVKWSGIADREPAADTAALAAADAAAGFTLWARNDDGSAVRWNPCEPIRWVFNPAGAPLGAVTELRKAMERVTAASGIEFEYLGETHELPARDRAPWQPETYDPAHWAPVLIAWRTPDTTSAPLGDHDRAVAIPVAVGTSESRTFVTAQVLFNEDLAGTPGFGDRRRSIGITMLHELLHVIGLGHVDDTAAIMFPFPVAGSADFSAGDLAGMEAVGASHGCVEVPEPEHIEVTYAQ